MEVMMRLIKNLLGKLIRLLYRLVYRLIPCQNDTVLFISFHGRGYSDNPMALHKYVYAFKVSKISMYFCY